MEIILSKHKNKKTSSINHLINNKNPTITPTIKNNPPTQPYHDLHHLSIFNNNNNNNNKFECILKWKSSNLIKTTIKNIQNQNKEY